MVELTSHSANSSLIVICTVSTTNSFWPHVMITVIFGLSIRTLIFCMKAPITRT